MILVYFDYDLYFDKINIFYLFKTSLSILL